MKPIPLLAGAFLFIPSLCAQLVNPGFEDADWETLRGQEGPPDRSSCDWPFAHYDPLQPWEVAAPGWQHTTGDDTGHVLLLPHLGISQMFVLALRLDPPCGTDSPWFEGDFALLLSSGHASSQDPDSRWIDAAILQEVMLPATADAVSFRATGPFRVSFAGNVLSPVQTGTWTYRAALAGFAGQSGELRFTKAPGGDPDDPFFDPDDPRNDWQVGIDAIEILLIPEPHVTALGSLLAAACLLTVRARSIGHRLQDRR